MFSSPSIGPGRPGAGLDIGTDFGRNAEVRLGYDVADYRGRRRVGAPDLPDVDGTEQFAHLDFGLDTQTSPIVPTRGFRLRSTLRQYFSAPTASHPPMASCSTARNRSRAAKSGRHGSAASAAAATASSSSARAGPRSAKIRWSTTSRSGVRYGWVRSTTIS